MNPAIAGINATLIALTPISSLALSDSDSAMAIIFQPEPQPITPVVYKNFTPEIRLENNASADILTGLIGSENFLSRVRSSRTNNLSMEALRTDLWVSNDSVSLKVYAPMDKMNRALSVAKAIPKFSLNDAQATWIQALLLARKRQINTELAYSVRMGGHSSFDSAITYRLNPDADSGTSEMAVSWRYSTRF